MHNDPVKNYKFEVMADGIYTVGCLAVCDLRVGRARKISFSRGVTNSREDKIFHNWYVDPPTTITVSVEDGRVTFRLENIEVYDDGLKFSDLDAGANHLLVQQIVLDADVTVAYAGVI